MHVAGGADIHRIRRDLDALRGSRKPAAKYHARNRDDLLGSRVSFGRGSLCGAACMAGVSTFSERGSSLCVYGRANIGAARLLYGMGRSNALPRSFFGAVDPKHQVPRNNVIFIGAIVLLGSFSLTYGDGVGLLNYGALL